MGWGAYEAMQGYGIEPIVTDMADIDKGGGALSRWQVPQSDGAPALNQMKGRS